MPTANYSEQKEKVRQLLEKIATQAGQETNFSQRQSKMTASCFSQTMILGSLADGTKSLTEYAQVSQDLGVTISASGLNQRLNDKGVNLLKKLLGQSLKLSVKSNTVDELLEQFTDIHLIDSSYLGLPKVLREKYPGIGRGTAAGLKLFLNYSYKYGRICKLEIESGRTADQKSRVHIGSAQAESLSLFDLGFFKQELFGEFDRKKAYFVSRYLSPTALYEENKDRFELWPYLRDTKEQFVDLRLRIGAKAKSPIRFVALRLPTDVAKERRRKAKIKAKKDGRRPSLSTSYLNLLDWALFVTNVPDSMLSVAQIATIYRIRWQIELVFKVWKSRGKLKEIGNHRINRVLCQFYARLIALVLFHFLVAPYFALNKRLSLAKAFVVIKHQVQLFVGACSGKWHLFIRLLQRVDRNLTQFAQQDKRRSRPTTYQLLLSAGL